MDTPGHTTVFDELHDMLEKMERLVQGQQAVQEDVGSRAVTAALLGGAYPGAGTTGSRYPGEGAYEWRSLPEQRQQQRQRDPPGWAAEQQHQRPSSGWAAEQQHQRAPSGWAAEQRQAPPAGRVPESQEQQRWEKASVGAWLQPLEGPRTDGGMDVHPTSTFRVQSARGLEETPTTAGRHPGRSGVSMPGGMGQQQHQQVYSSGKMPGDIGQQQQQQVYSSNSMPGDVGQQQQPQMAWGGDSMPGGIGGQQQQQVYSSGGKMTTTGVAGDMGGAGRRYSRGGMEEADLSLVSQVARRLSPPPLPSPVFGLVCASSPLSSPLTLDSLSPPPQVHTNPHVEAWGAHRETIEHTFR